MPLARQKTVHHGSREKPVITDGRNPKEGVMRSVRLAILLLVAGTAMSAAAADLAAAKKDFVRFCAKCHGNEGKGDGPQADALTTKPRDFTDCTRMKAMSDETIFTAIKEGGEAVHLSKDMPAWKEGMDDPEIHDLVAYVRTFCKQ
jgi:cytochrome c oxidase cbb3-type subunit 3